MSAEQCTPVGGMINPSMFPIPETDPGELEGFASSLRSDGTTLFGVGSDIKSAWGGLTSCYTAPEADTLYSVVDPVVTDGENVETGMDNAATALETFAEEVRGIQGRWATLKTDSYAFLAGIEGDDDWKSPDTWSWEWWSGGESPKVAEHQALLDRADQLRQDFEAAEITCANAINAGLPGRTNFVHSDGSDPGANEYAHGYDGYLGDVDMAWGGPQETDDAWFVDVGSAVKDFGVGAFEDLGGMLGMHSSEGWFQMSWGDALWENYSESIQGAASLVGMYDSESGDWGWAGWDNVGTAWRDMAHAVVPWEEWGDRPWYVIGTAALNIGAMVGGALLSATGVGAVVGVPLMAWRGSAMLNRMDGGRGPDLDVPDTTPDLTVHLNLPRFAGGTRDLFSFNLPNLDLGGVSPSRMTDMQGALDRLLNRNNGLDVGDDTGSPSNTRPRTDDSDATGTNRRTYQDDPTTQDLHDGMTVEDVLNPTSPEASRLRNRYEGDFLENDVRSDGAPGSWEASPTGRDGDSGDGPEMDREPALVGPRADTADAAATPNTPPNQRINLADSDSDTPDNRNDDDGNRYDVDARDDTPTVNNSVNDGDGTGPRDTIGDDSSNDTRVNDPVVDSNTSTSGDLPGGRGPTNTSGDLPTRGNGNNGADTETPRTGPTIDPNNPAHQALLPGEGQRFGDGVQLDSNTRYTLLGPDGGLRTEYITDGQGNISEIRVDSRRWNSEHPEFLDPRPNMTYVVDDYRYRTDDFGRTESVEGTLRNGPNVRNESEQSWVNSQGQTYYERLNEQLRNEFEQSEGRPPTPGEVPQYQTIQWDGGHLIGYAEFFGIGERLNQVPMRFDVNQNRTDTALPDIPEEARGGIDGSYRNLERSWRGLMNHGSGWHNFNDLRFNDGSWNDALALNPNNPQIDVKITNAYDPNLKPVEAPSDYDLRSPHFVGEDGRIMIPPPPRKIEVEWWLNGVRMRMQKYNNLPPLV